MHCPACQTAIDDSDAFCRRCGAVLQGPAASRLRPRPAIDRSAYVDPGPAPRTPPSWFMTAQEPMGAFWLLFGSIFAFVGTVLGVVFTLVGVATGETVFLFVGPGVLLLFGGIGYGSLGVAIGRIRKARRIWRDGDAREASVIEVGRDRSLRVNGRSPLLVRYRYDILGQKFEGAGHTWHDGWGSLGEDARVAVLVDRDVPQRSLLHLPAPP